MEWNLSPSRRPDAPVETQQRLIVIESAVMQILRSLPVSRRPLADWVKQLHVEVTCDRRNGYCPCCSRVMVACSDGRIDGAEFDHWYGRHRNGPEETWLVCGPCNRQLEDPLFKSRMRACFDAYQAALQAVMRDAQGLLFE